MGWMHAKQFESDIPIVNVITTASSAVPETQKSLVVWHLLNFTPLLELEMANQGKLQRMPGALTLGPT